LIGGIEENHEKTSIRNSDHRVKIWTRDLPNMKQVFWPLDHDYDFLI
jgi:hypothetical protein